MNKRFLMALSGAAIFGLLAIVMARSYMQGEMNRQREEQNVRVLIASADIPFGSTIQDSQLETADYPRALAQAQAVLTDRKAVVGKVAAYEIPARVAIIPRYLSSGELLPEKVTEGYRAASVPVNEASSVAGFVRPGTWVDVISVLPAGGNRTMAKTILQNIRVLAAGNQMQARSETDQTAARPQNFNTVTLEVTPEQAETLALALREGTIQLVIRNPNDKDEVRTNPVQSARSLTAAPSGTPAVASAAPVRPTPTPPPWIITDLPTPTPTPAPAVRTVDLYKGKEHQKVQFPAREADAASAKSN